MTGAIAIPAAFPRIQRFFAEASSEKREAPHKLLRSRARRAVAHGDRPRACAARSSARPASNRARSIPRTAPGRSRPGLAPRDEARRPRTDDCPRSIDTRRARARSDLRRRPTPRPPLAPEASISAKARSSCARSKKAHRRSPGRATPPRCKADRAKAPTNAKDPGRGRATRMREDPPRAHARCRAPHATDAFRDRHAPMRSFFARATRRRHRSRRAKTRRRAQRRDRGGVWRTAHHRGKTAKFRCFFRSSESAEHDQRARALLPLRDRTARNSRRVR